MKITNLMQAKDSDIIYVYDLNGNFICKGKWYQDNVLEEYNFNRFNREFIIR